MLKTSLSGFGRDGEERGVESAYPPRRFDHAPIQPEARALLQVLASQPCLAAPIMPNGRLVIYGAGNFGLMALDFLRDVGIRPAFVIDAKADQIRQSAAWAGVDVYTPDEVPEDFKSEALLAVSVVTSPVSPILQQLESQGWKHCVPFYDLAESFRPTHPLSNGWFAHPLDTNDLANIGLCLDDWADDLSRAHHLMFLAWRLARQEWQFDGVSVDNSNRFFIPEVRAILKDEDIFLDGGAHHGSVSETFLAATGAASRIVAFEPDEKNADRFAAWLSSRPEQDQARVDLRRTALDARPRHRQFHGDLGYMSQFSASGSMNVLTETIDATDLMPGFVKLHLEGGELDALEGGLESFRRSRPIIAVTVYHNADGMWRTARWMRKNLEDYSLLMRTHSWCGTGAVIYALPNERKSRAC